MIGAEDGSRKTNHATTTTTATDIGVQPITWMETPPVDTPPTGPPTSTATAAIGVQLITNTGKAQQETQREGAISPGPLRPEAQLNDKEAGKIAATAGPSPHPKTAPNTEGPPRLPHKKLQRPSPAPRTSSATSTATPDASTTAHGIVVHGIALRKDLGKVRKWLEASNKLGKTVGIRWLIRKTILVEEEKKTSSVVVYLEKPIEVGDLPDNTTSKHSVVIHGIALRKDLGNVRRWLEASNKDIGKIVGIRWLRRKLILVEEGKTSPVVVYLETQREIAKVTLGGKVVADERVRAGQGKEIGRSRHMLTLGSSHPHYQ
ncbi:hypothetical protein BDZ91DRAFT_792006 [Kalaharituber pfeilii]|nr:hypothetical protein BDZ91DRAFT_792006 [Kalaharituber pfeilii]